MFISAMLNSMRKSTQFVGYKIYTVSCVVVSDQVLVVRGKINREGIL